MVQFTRLRLTGFKSFVDPTELVIESGLTGVVGPNGCGKSNLVEALRWVMGETSAKQMRGGEMDDVIFGGTSQRPARNIAEVTIDLDNSDGSATAFRQFPDLEVTRRIERGSGSAYRVNGKEARARDVQLLFADAATGARSTAMVSQGRVGAIIAAKPAQRRALLEEAAGISGLHTRRHEAELRLKGAESNLERLDDVLSALDGQARNLRKQARQAAQYREISEAIRHAEAVVLRRRWLAAIRGLDRARTALRESERQVGEATAAATAASTAHEAAAEALDPLRERATETAAAVQRLVVERERLEAEARRVDAALTDNRTRLEQTDRDRAREQTRAADAETALARLTQEQTALHEAAAGEDAAREASAARLKVVNADVNARESEATRATQALAEADAQRAALDRRLAETTQRAERLARRRDDLTREVETARARALDPADLERAAEAVTAVETTQAEATARREQAEAARIEARGAFDAAREAAQGVAAERASLRAEVQALEQMLTREAPPAGNAPPVLEALSVAPGYETALGAALGDDLTAALDPAAPAFWAALPLGDAAPLPSGVGALADHVQGPPAVARALASIGVVRDRATGDALRHDLRPGQRLVTADGDLWRWDGLTLRAGAGAGAAAGAQAAARLRTRNRLAELTEALTAAEARVAEAETTVQTARDALTRAEEGERAARAAVKAADGALSQARAAQEAMRRKAAEAETRLASVKATLDQVTADGAEATTQAEAARVERADLGDGTEARAALETLRADLTAARTALVEARAEHDRRLREIGERERRTAAVADELASWTARRDQGRATLADLDTRRAEIAAALAELEPAPERLRADQTALADAIRTAETDRAAAADALAAAETRARETDGARKAADTALAQARETRVRRESEVEQGQATCRTVAAEVADRLDCTPEALPETAGLAPDDALPALTDAEADLTRLARQRDGIGPVNLRAEAELAELDEKVAGLRHEREDLTGAIARLRQAIAEINREGRQRLVESFTAVNEHFRTLFTGLFGGGQAYLEMIESADPLEAGLEIMASPPGKRLQILSLLSGGEQALTALALLFAVFLTNPAPICVLDEVDAPLDDANVDRMCSLLEELTKTTATRFLLVTHHRMSMARMDRLFGVTMMERGVSKLVSVDLREAEILTDQPAQGVLV
ncbi:chromosome segregation protein SMC [Roseospira marina]|uniref:Chromosome partition protein Smc n=1 Tax=Roseospira marina TaxID=140057 RepID=A0A5M6IEM1_9PROT|nr:chromosome segregation protein SMC [Roseospira marina]KAA5606165.1 chromosome segregation protein SMC [Roseospira marina]MBB4314305.1 chromosome segregation protein [Roseospira marina]MBB5087465.1 chromosome segregation protein [Roseospira marina]